MRLARNSPDLPMYNRRNVSNYTWRRCCFRFYHGFVNKSLPVKFLIVIFFSIVFLSLTVISNSFQRDFDDELVEVTPVEIIIPKDVNQRHDIVDDKVIEMKESHGLRPNFEGPTNDRQREVVKAFQFAWKAYKKYAWGRDQLKPVSKGYSTWFDTGLTIVDALDTAIIMGLENEVIEGTEWIRNNLTFDKSREVNFFECTIRVVGGLLSAYHLTGDKMFLDKATDVGDRLMAAYNTKSPIPYSDVNLGKGNALNPSWTSYSSLSEVTSVQLEFRDLSRLTGNSEYEEKAFKTSQHIHDIGCDDHDGLCNMLIDAKTGKFKPQTTITFGARADSYYEYLYKQWLQTGKTIDWLKEDYLKAMNAMEKHLYRHSEPKKLWFIGELLSGETYYPKMDHLVCFIAGTLAHGSQNGMPKKHLEMAEKIGETCYEMYRNPTGLGPEIAHFNMLPGKDDLYIKPLDAHSLLRPEAVEAWFYLYRITGDKKYQEWGWSVFKAIERYAKIVTGGYSSISNVKRTNVSYRDMMESFFLAETLKYLYLLLADDQSILPLDQWVFNTEAHPLPIYNN